MIYSQVSVIVYGKILDENYIKLNMKYTVPAYCRNDAPSDGIPGGFFVPQIQSEKGLKKWEERQ